MNAQQKNYCKKRINEAVTIKRREIDCEHWCYSLPTDDPLVVEKDQIIRQMIPTLKPSKEVLDGSWRYTSPLTGAFDLTKLIKVAHDYDRKIKAKVEHIQETAKRITQTGQELIDRVMLTDMDQDMALQALDDFLSHDFLNDNISQERKDVA